MNSTFLSRKFQDPGFSLEILVYSPEERGECEWKVGYTVDFNGTTEAGYAIGIDGIDAIVNAIAEVRRVCLLLSADSKDRSWHLLPYVAPTIDQTFDQYVERLVVSARDFYWRHKEPPPLPSWDNP